MVESPCRTKRAYDSEFEAEIAANKAGYRWEAEMVWYKCGTHWHIANKHPELRSKNRKFNQTYCPDCKTYMKRGRWEFHIKKAGHKTNQRKTAS